MWGNSMELYLGMDNNLMENLWVRFKEHMTVHVTLLWMSATGCLTEVKILHRHLEIALCSQALVLLGTLITEISAGESTQQDISKSGGS